MGVTAVTEKVELGSAPWVELAAAYLQQAIPALGEAVDDVTFSMCEIFTDAPSHFADQNGAAAWWFRIAGRSVEVGRGPRDDVDVRIEVDHTDTLALARKVYRVTNVPTEGPLDGLPSEVRAALTGLHNYLARRTA